MTLTADQKAWADQHVGQETTLRGAVSSWREIDGRVEFCVTFTATPPPTPEKVAQREKQAAAERAASEEAHRVMLAEQERARVQAQEAVARRVVVEELDKRGVGAT